jgi:hybrid cluster-associated redox disulfide protein
MIKKKITGDMALGEVVMKYPETVPIFFKHGLPCAMCHLAFGETVAQGAATHGIKLNQLLKELNKEVSKKKKK